MIVKIKSLKNLIEIICENNSVKVIRVKVCQNAFLKIVGLKRSLLRKKVLTNRTVSREYRPNKTDYLCREDINDFVVSLPTEKHIMGRISIKSFCQQNSEVLQIFTDFFWTATL